jgi:hypothetical protein
MYTVDYSMVERELKKAAVMYDNFKQWLDDASVVDEQSAKRVQQLREIGRQRFHKIVVAGDELIELTNNSVGGGV